MSGLAIGSELGGRYRLVRRIGAGGMGTVYEAIVRDSGVRVAVKTLHAGEASRQKAARFRREARAVAAIRHPAVVRTLDVGATEDGMPFLVMEILRGCTLGALRDEAGRIPLGPAVAILEAVLSGLGAAHEAGVVHRDLKPDNVFLHVEESTGGPVVAVKLLDFGIAKLFEGRETAQLTGTGVILGTPEYMSPEQASGTDVDARVDVYACGLLGYEMLSGKRPFGDLPPQQIFSAILAGSSVPLSRVAPDLAPELVAWIERAMARDRDARFATAAAALAALRATATALDLGPAIASAPSVLAGLVAVEPASRKRPLELAETLAAHSTSSGDISEPPVVVEPMRRRMTTIAFAVGLVVATIVNALTVGPTLRGLPVFAPLRTGLGLTLGAALIGLAWSGFALGAPIARDAHTARVVVALGASQAVHHFYLALLALAPAVAAHALVETLGRGAVVLAVPAMAVLARQVLGLRPSRVEPIAWGSAIVIGLLAARPQWLRATAAGNRAGPILLLVTAMTLASALGSAAALVRAARAQPDLDRARRLRSVALGLATYGVLLSANVLPLLGVAVQVLSLVGLLPIGLIAYGALGIDTVALGRRRATLAIGLFGRLSTMMLGVYVAAFLVLASGRVGPHTNVALVGPPLVTAVVALVLSWRVLSADAPTLRTWLTGLATGSLGVLKLTWAYAAMMPRGGPVDASGIAWFSQAANTWFVFYVPLIVHLARLVTRRQGERWVLYTAYGLALFVAPLTLSGGYFAGVRSFWFGTIVQGGWGFALFYSVAGGCFGYVVTILLDGLRRAEGRDRATRVLVTTGIFGTSVLVIADGASVSGAEVYPLGNFAFVPLVVLAYGLLRGEIPELSTFVRRGLLHAALSALLAVSAGALLVTISAHTKASSALLGGTLAALVVVVTIEPLRRLGQAGIDRILGQTFDDHGALERLGRLPSAFETPRALADEAARLLGDASRATSAIALLEGRSGEVEAPNRRLSGDDPVLREVRRTGAPLRCGPEASFAVPSSLSDLGREIVLLPLATPMGFLGVLVVAPSTSEPLVVAAARRFLSSYADLAALLIDRARMHEGVDAEVERRTRALTDVIAELERRGGPRPKTTVDDDVLEPPVVAASESAPRERTLVEGGAPESVPPHGTLGA